MFKQCIPSETQCIDCGIMQMELPSSAHYADFTFECKIANTVFIEIIFLFVIVT